MPRGRERMLDEGKQREVGELLSVGRTSQVIKTDQNEPPFCSQPLAKLSENQAFFTSRGDQKE